MSKSRNHNTADEMTSMLKPDVIYHLTPWREFYMPEEIIEISAPRELPEIEIIVGHAHLGQYQVGMFDENNQNPVMIRTGDNTVTFDDKFPITDSIPSLHNKLLVWGVLVTAFSGISDPYSVTVILTQGTQELARHARTGNLSNGMAPEVGEWRLKVV